MTHFLLYTGAGLLVLSIAACALVSVVVWYAVETAVAAIAWTCWRCTRAITARAARPYSPGGKA